MKAGCRKCEVTAAQLQRLVHIDTHGKAISLAAARATSAIAAFTFFAEAVGRSV